MNLETFLSKYKPREHVSDSLDELIDKFNYFNKPCVLKITNELHKTEKKGVILNINSLDELKKAYLELSKLSNKLLLQEQVKGIELFVGSKVDNVFGKIILFGIGGIFTEIYEDISIRKIPISKGDIESMINDLKGKKLLEGYRNININKDKLYEFLINLSKILEKEEYKELDLNPVIINEENLYCVDVKVIR